MASPFYRFDEPLEEGTIVSRPNRFIMIVKTGRRTIRCHCPSTGRLGDVVLSGLPCLYSTARNSERKTGYTVEAISIQKKGRSWIGINQSAANRYFEYFMREGALRRLARGGLRREVSLGDSRIDFEVGRTYIEVKTPLIRLPAGHGVSRRRQGKFDSFERLIRHMGELRDAIAAGSRAKIVLCYLYDAEPFTPPPPDGTNRRILAAARAAERAGVERWQVNLRVNRSGVSLVRYFKSRPYGS